MQNTRIEYCYGTEATEGILTGLSRTLSWCPHCHGALTGNDRDKCDFQKYLPAFPSTGNGRFIALSLLDENISIFIMFLTTGCFQNVEKYHKPLPSSLHIPQDRMYEMAIVPLSTFELF